jgi:hypothetical protein
MRFSHAVPFSEHAASRGSVNDSHITNWKTERSHQQCVENGTNDRTEAFIEDAEVFICVWMYEI